MATRPQENVLSIEGSGRVPARRDRRIGSLLAEAGKLGATDIERVMELQQKEGLRFGEAAHRLGLISEDDLHCALASQYDFPYLRPGSERIDSELVVASDPFHPRAEELWALRSQLLIRWSNREAGRRALAIVSPGRGEGRSYIAANLAVVFSQLGERTVLIDADLRAPRQHQIFGIPDRIGLSAVLSGRADRGAVVPVPKFGALSVLPAGACPPNPQELLSRHALSVLLNELATEFNFILLDTPPAMLYPEAQSVAFRAGNVMLLARKGRTRVADTTSVIRELGDTGVCIVGTVFNAF
jgi:protein-tyrosine kinase